MKRRLTTLTHLQQIDDPCHLRINEHSMVISLQPSEQPVQVGQFAGIGDQRLFIRYLDIRPTVRLSTLVVCIGEHFGGFITITAFVSMTLQCSSNCINAKYDKKEMGKKN